MGEQTDRQTELNSKPEAQEDSKLSGPYFTSILYTRSKRYMHSFSVLWFEYDFTVTFWALL